MLFEVCMSFLNYFSYVVLLTVIGCRISARFTYHVKLFLIYANFCVTAVVMFVFGGIGHGIYSTCTYSLGFFLPLVYWFDLTFDVQLPENYDKKQPYVVIMNHQHALDAATAGKIWPHLNNRVRVVVKKELGEMGPLSKGLANAGAIFVDRASSEKGRATMNEAGREAVAEGHSIIIFPEGTRNVTGTQDILPFKKGAFHVAVDAGMPILPVVISKYDFMDTKAKVFKPSGKITVRLLEPIQTKGLTKEDVNHLVESSRNKMLEVFHEISGGGANKNEEEEEGKKDK